MAAEAQDSWVLQTTELTQSILNNSGKEVPAKHTGEEQTAQTPEVTNGVPHLSIQQNSPPETEHKCW